MEPTTFAPAWITTLLVAALLVVLLLLKARPGKKGLNREMLLSSVVESIGGIHAILSFINICYQWSFEVGKNSAIFRLPDSYLVTAFYILAIFLDMTVKNWRKFKHKRR